MTLREFAVSQHVSRSTVYNWKNKGFLQLWKINGKFMVDACFCHGGNSMKKPKGVSVVKQTYVDKKGQKHEYTYKRVTLNDSCPAFYPYAKQLIDNRTDVKWATKKKLLDVLEKYIKPDYEYMPVTSITRDMLKETLNTAQAQRAEIKQIFTQTFRELTWNDLVPRDISQGLRLPKFDQDDNPIVYRKRRKMPSWDELMRFCNYTMGNHLKNSYVVILMFCAGLSRSEVLALKKSDFNFDECSVMVNKAWVLGKDRQFRISSPKNKYRVRKAFFPSSIIPILQQGMSRTRSQWFASDHTGKHPMDANNFYNRYFRGVAKKLNIESPIGCHTPRHVYITCAIDAGVPPTEVMHQVGHKDLRMIMQVYTHYIQHKGPTEQFRQYMQDIANKVLGNTKKEVNPERSNLIQVDFRKRLG